MDLLKLMLQKNPEKRISAKDALNHPYFNVISQSNEKPTELVNEETTKFSYNNNNEQYFFYQKNKFFEMKL